MGSPLRMSVLRSKLIVSIWVVPCGVENFPLSFSFTAAATLIGLGRVISLVERSVRPHVTTFFLPLHRFRPLMIAVFVSAAVVLTAACGGGSTSSASPAGSNASASGSSTPAANGSSVSVRMFKFDPTPLKIAAGTKVTWMNSDDILHTVTSGAPGSEDGKFNGEMSAQGTSFSFAFTTPGTYSYFCSRHNGMRGEVQVS